MKIVKKNFKTNNFFPLNSWFYKYEIYKEIFLADFFWDSLFYVERFVPNMTETNYTK
jgi:hypothetical protein